MVEEDWVSVMIDRERYRELGLEKLERFSREKIVEFIVGIRARDTFKFTQILISQFGKEKAWKLIEESIYSAYYKRGRETAEKMGNPPDLDTYLDVYVVKAVADIPHAPPCIIWEKTKNKAVWGVTRCSFAEALLKLGEEDPETLDVAKARCAHDVAWAMGFNPKMKCKRTQFLLDGDDRCEFTCEIGE